MHTHTHTHTHTGLTLATAGVAATFNLIIKDQFGNVQDIPSSLAFARIDPNPACGPEGSGRSLAGNCSASISIIPAKVQVGGLNKFTVMFECFFFFCGVCVCVCVCVFVFVCVFLCLCVCVCVCVFV